MKIIEDVMYFCDLLYVFISIHSSQSNQLFVNLLSRPSTLWIAVLAGNVLNITFRNRSWNIYCIIIIIIL